MNLTFLLIILLVSQLTIWKVESKKITKKIWKPNEFTKKYEEIFNEDNSLMNLYEEYDDDLIDEI